MTPENFVYWLQGYFEIMEAVGANSPPLNGDQVKVIKDHLKLVLEKKTPFPFVYQTPVTNETACDPVYYRPNSSLPAVSC